MEDQILIAELLIGLILLILFLAIAWFFYFNVVYRPDCLAVARLATPQDIQRQSYPEMAPPSNNDATKHLNGLRYRNSKDGSPSSNEDKYSGREKVTVDEIANGIQNQSGISTYYMSSDSMFNTEEGGKCEERDAGEESYIGEGRFEECDCEASGSNIANSAGTSQDFNEVDKIVSENVGQCENSSKNFETVDNDKCNNEYNKENKSEVDAVNVANSEVASDKESHTGKGRFEECDSEASGSNMDKSAGGSTSQDFNEVDKTVIKNVDQCENSSKNFETVDNDKCNYEHDEENKSEVDAVNLENSEVESDKESHTGKGRFEECDCEASGSNIDNSAGGSTSQDFNEVDKTVIENFGQCENSSKNFETVDNDKCNNEHDEENKSEVDAVNVANSEVESIDQ